MGVEFYVVLRWRVGTFHTHQLILHAGTDEEAAKETAKLVRQLAERIGLCEEDDPYVTVVTEYQLIHQIEMATKTIIIQPAVMWFVQ